MLKEMSLKWHAKIDHSFVDKALKHVAYALFLILIAALHRPNTIIMLSLILPVK